MLGIGRRELRRCLCICVRVQHGASGVQIVRITLGNYHVEPQSREARLWLVPFKNASMNLWTVCMMSDKVQLMAIFNADGKKSITDKYLSERL